jgi:hypothetical protein
MKCLLISDEQMDDLLDQAFNEPVFTDSFSSSDFYQEWKDVQTEIKKALLKIGLTSWNEGGEDYGMSDDWGYSRHHGICIHREQMMKPNLIPVVLTLLETLNERYQIDIHHDLFLRHEIKPFDVIVRKDIILAHSEDPQLLKRLGLEG